MRKKKHQMKNKKKTYLISILIVLLIAILAIVSLNKEEIYTVDSRIKKVENDKKKDKTGVTTLGWIKVQGTNIDYPVLYIENDASVNINREKFAWTDNKKEKIYNHVVITGHNILNLSRKPRINDKDSYYFEDLMSFIYPEFIEKNKYIQYTINGKDYIYKIYAVRVLKTQKKDIVFQHNVSEKEIIAYANKAKKESLYDTNISIKPYDGLITLLTCTRIYGSQYKSVFIVEGRLLRVNERATNYSVKTTDNFKKVENLMKGDEEDV